MTKRNFPPNILIQVHHLIAKNDTRSRWAPASEKLLSPHVKHISYYSRNTQEALLRMGIKCNLYKLNQFVDIDRFKSVRLPKSSKKLTIGCFGQDLPRKCFDILYKALDKMKNMELITTLAPKHPKVKRFGGVTDEKMVELFNRLDCYVSTSDVEGGPVGVLEAMACGIPVVITNTGFTGDILKNGINGFVIPFYDTRTLIERLEWTRENPGRARVMGENGKMTVSEYTPKAFSEQYINLFGKIKDSFF